MGDSSLQPQSGLTPDGSSLISTMSGGPHIDDKQGNSGNNADLQKLYTDYFASSNNNNPLVQVLKTWYQQSSSLNTNVNALNSTPLHRSINQQPAFPPPMHTVNPASMIPTPTLLPPPPPPQFENKKRRIDDVTERIAKRPRPMVIPSAVEFRKALGVPKDVPYFTHHRLTSGCYNLPNTVEYPHNCFLTPSQPGDYRPSSQNRCYAVSGQQNMIPPVLSPIQTTSGATNANDSTVFSCPQLDRCGSANDNERQTPSIEDQKLESEASVQSLVNQLVKLVESASSKNACNSTDLGTAITEAHESLFESNSYLKATTYFKVHEVLASKPKLSPDEKVLFNAVNLVLINQVVRPMFAERDSGISESQTS